MAELAYLLLAVGVGVLLAVALVSLFGLLRD